MDTEQRIMRQVGWQDFQIAPSSEEKPLSRRGLFKVLATAIGSCLLSACAPTLGNGPNVGKIEIENNPNINYSELLKDYNFTDECTIAWMPKTIDKYWNKYFVPFSKKYGLDPRIAAVMALVESGFDSSAISWSGAQGIMQIMSDTESVITNKLIADGELTENYDVYDPETNIKMGVYYLKSMLDYLGENNLRWAVLAYHDGPGRTKKSMIYKSNMTDEGKEYMRRFDALWTDVDKGRFKSLYFNQSWATHPQVKEAFSEQGLEIFVRQNGSQSPPATIGGREITGGLNDEINGLFINPDRTNLDVHKGRKWYRLEVINGNKLKISIDVGDGGWDKEIYRDSLSFTTDEGIIFSYRQNPNGKWRWVIDN